MPGTDSLGSHCLVAAGAASTFTSDPPGVSTSWVTPIPASPEWTAY